MLYDIGVVPFQGRGKSDVDYLVQEAARRPGPGSYNLPSGPRVGGKFSIADTPTALDQFITSRSYIPGPGAYNDVTGVSFKKPNAIRTLTKVHGLDNSINEQFQELLENYN